MMAMGPKEWMVRMEMAIPMVSLVPKEVPEARRHHRPLVDWNRNCRHRPRNREPERVTARSLLRSRSRMTTLGMIPRVLALV